MQAISINIYFISIIDAIALLEKRKWDMAGFDEMAYLSRVFHARKGITTSVYRKLHQL